MMIDIDILLASGAKYKKVRKGEYLFHEGAVCNYYFQLVEGRVSWVNFDDEGKIFIQSILEPGECFGELPLFDDEPYAANAVAEVDSVIIQLPKLSFSQLLRNNFDIQVAFNRLLAQRVRYKFFILKEIACCSPEHRILTLLTYLSKKNNINNTEHFVVNYTRQQIAGMTGLRVETVIRVIRHLHDQGKLMIDKGKIIMPNHDYNHKIFA